MVVRFVAPEKAPTAPLPIAAPAIVGPAVPEATPVWLVTVAPEKIGDAFVAMSESFRYEKPTKIGPFDHWGAKLIALFFVPPVTEPAVTGTTPSVGRT